MQLRRTSQVTALAVAVLLLAPGPAGASEREPPAEGIGVHRGLRTAFDGRVADEDSVRACLAAVSARADVCEVDVRVTGDGVPVLMHDASTGRVTRGRRCDLVVARHTYRELARCRLNNGDAITPLYLLSNAMRPLSHRVALVVELKAGYLSDTHLRRISYTLSAGGFGPNRGNLVYESYQSSQLIRMKRFSRAPGYVISTGAPSAEVVAAAGLDGLVIRFPSLVAALRRDPAYVARFSGSGLGVLPWQVNSLTSVRYLLAHGLRGFLTDTADTVRAALRLRGAG